MAPLVNRMDSAELMSTSVSMFSTYPETSSTANPVVHRMMSNRWLAESFNWPPPDNARFCRHVPC